MMREEVLKIMCLHLVVSWRNLEFLDDQGVSADSPPSSTWTGLDLSTDQLFLLSAGMRQIYLMAHPHFHSEQSIFSISTIFKACNVLNDVCDERGIDVSFQLYPDEHTGQQNQEC